MAAGLGASTFAALPAVLREEWPHEREQLILAVARVRMTAEDYRVAATTWRRQAGELDWQIQGADDLIEEARTSMLRVAYTREATREDLRVGLFRASNFLRDARHALRREDSRETEEN